MSRFDDITDLFTSPEVDAILATVMREISESGGMTPRIVAHAGNLIPARFGLYRSLLIDVAVGTLRAGKLGKNIEGWLFTNMMAEQSTHPLIAAHHASRFADRHHVLEICTGSAMDTLALSRVVDRVTSFEADEVAAAVASANLQRCGVTNVKVIHRPFPSDDVDLDPIDGIWSDPSRRTASGGRVFDASQYSPPLTVILHHADILDAAMHGDLLLGVKTGPADYIDETLIEDLSSEYIGFRGECRERLLWKGAGVPQILVTLVDADAQWSPSLATAPRYDAEMGDENYLIEPHAAVIASGYVEDFLHDVGMPALDSQIAYGISPTEPPASPFYDRFAIHAMDEGVTEKKIKKRLATFQWGRRTEFKKRGWPGDP
jgi:hypothetical protein